MVRPPYGGVRPALAEMPGPRPALSAVLALLAGVLLSVGIAACGGEKVSADEVTLPPPELTIPESADPTPSRGGRTTTGGSSTTDTTSTSTTDTTTGAEGGAGDATPTPSPSGTGGSAAPAEPTATPTPAAQPQEDSSTSDTAPPAGSGAQKFEEFCQQNPGAC